MRFAKVNRTTKETDVLVELNLEGGGTDVSTGIGFFDHMLTSFAVHGGFGLIVKVAGDLHVDGHHTVEDAGIVLGQAFAKALKDKAGIVRFGSFFVPMDEALAFAAADISGRPFLRYCAEFPQQEIGDYSACLTEEFMRAFAIHAGITLHIKLEYGSNSHHMTEAIFKAVAHALKIAVQTDEKITLLSTKGSL